MAILKNTTVSDTGFLQLPVGTTAQRPTPANGQMRFNTNLGRAEFYNATAAAWLGTAAAGVIATGGTVYDVDVEGTTYRVHVFTSTGNSTFTVTQGGSVEYLIVAGGGGGGSRRGGGGGAGGLLTGIATVTPQSYTVTVGAGGLGLVTNTTDGIIQQRSNGGSSSVFGLTAIGGGAGGHYNIANANSGGSGAGGSGSSRTNGASGTAGQGNSGGNGVAAEQIGAGGGGAGSPGENGIAGGTAGKPGDGGIGVVSSISGYNTFYAGGGAGGRGDGDSFTDNRQRGTGGFGGGGFGGNNSTFPGPGTPNTGGGGGAHGGSHGVVDQSRYGISEGAAGENGGSGVVIVRYPLRQENPVTAAGRVEMLAPVVDLDFAKSVVYSGAGDVLQDASTVTPVALLVNSPTYSDRRTHRSSFELRGTASATHLLLTPEINFPFPWTQRIVFVNTASTETFDFRVALTGDPSSSRPGYIRLINDIIDDTARVRFLFRYRNSAGTWTSHSDYVGPFGSSYVPFAQQDAYWVNNIIDLTVTMAPNQVYRYYINGSQVGSRTRTTSNDQDNGLRFSMIGARGTGGVTETLNGKIYLAQFYNRQLSAAEIQNEFNATRWRFGV